MKKRTENFVDPIDAVVRVIALFLKHGRSISMELIQAREQYWRLTWGKKKA